MQTARITLTFQVEKVDGKTLDEIFDIVDEQLRKSGLDEVFNPLWESTKVYDEKGNFVDGDYC